MKKIIALILTSVMCLLLLASCGGGNNETTKPDSTTQKPAEITQKPVETTQKPAETTQKPATTTPTWDGKSLEEIMNVLTSSTEIGIMMPTGSEMTTDDLFIIGIDGFTFKEGYSYLSGIGSQAFVMALFRVESGTDMDAYKQYLKDNANPGKWICVCADNVIVESVGDVVLFAMIDSELVGDVNAITSAFLAGNTAK